MAFAYTKLTNDLLTDRLYFDAIIIGAGAAGSIAAALFARMGIRVLVLDAGLRSGFLARPYSMRSRMACGIWRGRVFIASCRPKSSVRRERD